MVKKADEYQQSCAFRECDGALSGWQMPSLAPKES